MMEKQEQQQVNLPMQQNQSGNLTLVGRNMGEGAESSNDIYKEFAKLEKDTRRALVAFLFSGYEEEYTDYEKRNIEYPDPRDPTKTIAIEETYPIQRFRYIQFVKGKPSNVNETGTEELTNFVTALMSDEFSTTYYNPSANISGIAAIIAKLAMRQLVLECDRYEFEVNPVIASSFGALVFNKVNGVLSRSRGGFYFKGVSETHVVHTSRNESPSNLSSAMDKDGFLKKLVK
jgi:hypothetical protein